MSSNLRFLFSGAAVIAVCGALWLLWSVWSELSAPLPSLSHAEAPGANNIIKASDSRSSKRQSVNPAQKKKQPQTSPDLVKNDLPDTVIVKSQPEQEASHTQWQEYDTTEETEVPAEIRLEAEIARLDMELRLQPTDKDWSWEADELILNTLEHVLDHIEPELADASALLSSECRDTLCKLELAHFSETVREEFTGEFFRQLDWPANVQLINIDNEDGSADSVIYLLREGI